MQSVPRLVRAGAHLGSKQPPEILVRLRGATGRLHQEAERAMDLPASVGSTADYVQLLGTLWTFYGALEARLGSIAGLAGALPDWAERRKSHLLAADLAALGARVPAGNAATSAALAAVDDLPAAFGALYVSEGSTLGGAIVGPNIRATLRAAAEPAEAFTFYGAYGPLLGSRWRDFIAALSLEADTSPAAPGRIVASACLTFETFIANLSREGGRTHAPAT